MAQGGFDMLQEKIGKWFTVGQATPTSSLALSSFTKQGPLVSIGREPPQNIIDNILDKTKPAIIKFTRKNISDVAKLREYLPQNPWIDHITTPQQDKIIKKYLDLPLPSTIDNGIEVLLIEDYNTTGLIGDTSQYLPDETAESNYSEYDEKSKNNTYLWFMRAENETKPKKGRGGSWGLGKLAIPLASSVRTFFCLTTQNDTNERWLAGQSYVNRHNRFGKKYNGRLYYAKDVDPENSSWWNPIDDNERINHFCKTFGVKREANDPGTSLVVPLPRRDLKDGANNLKNIVLCVISNYLVPISEGVLELHYDDPEFGSGQINSGNIESLLRSNKLPWHEIAERRNDSVNPAWSTKERMIELFELNCELNDQSEKCYDLNLLDTRESTSPVNDYTRIMPEKDSEAFIGARKAYHEGKFILVKGRICINEENVNEIKYGNYSLILRQCNKNGAEAHFYREQISLPLQNGKKPLHNNFNTSSLMKIMGEENPLQEMLRATEGPAHLSWDPKSERIDDYKYGPTIIRFLTDIGKKLIDRFHESTSQSEDIWENLFSNELDDGEDLTEENSKGEKKGSDDKKRKTKIINTRNFIIEPIEIGFKVKKRPGGESLENKQYILRMGYPKYWGENPDKPPDYRNIDIHNIDDWVFSGVEIDFDVQAKNIQLCKDRVRVTILKDDFKIEYNGQDPRKVAAIKFHKLGGE